MSSKLHFANHHGGSGVDANINAIHDEIKKLWAENASLRNDVKTLGTFVHVIRTAMLAVALLIVLSFSSGRIVFNVGGKGGGVSPSPFRGVADWGSTSARLRPLQTSANVRGRVVAGNTAEIDIATMRLDDGIVAIAADSSRTISDVSSPISRGLQAGSLELDIDEALLAAAEIDTSSVERSALIEFYVSAKGREWTVSTGWLDPNVEHCDWHGVYCDSNGNTVRLELPGNSLSGTLSTRIADLVHLEVLELHGNGIQVSGSLPCPPVIGAWQIEPPFTIRDCSLTVVDSTCAVYNRQGTIPGEIGMLSNLTRLKLNYNEFVGSGADLSDLSRLSLIHLQGNRLTGSIPPTNLNFQGKSSYISDCGNPSDFKASLGCEECTMCCKSPPPSVVIRYCLLA